MHRVVNLQSVGQDSDVINSHKDSIKNIRDNYSSYLHSSQINDGQNEDSKPTLGVNADFNDATQANNFHNEIHNFIKNNSSDFLSARTRVHDCNHASDRNEPCKIGDVKKIV